jgi:hypothetical protein
LNDGEVVAEGLAAHRGRYKDDITALPCAYCTAWA